MDEWLVSVRQPANWRRLFDYQFGEEHEAVMKILFYTPGAPSKEVGACKVVLELAEEMEALGWGCTVVGPTEVAAALPKFQQSLLPSERLRHYLLQHAANYDVVDYEHPHLPFPRSDFPCRPLFVARSVMLLHHLEQYPVPIGRSLKSKVGHLLKGNARQQLRRSINNCFYTIQQADLVNLCNDDEKATLIEHGIPAEKMIVLPFGISRARRPLFDAISSQPPASPVVAFVGTFDYRKGANEFPTIVQHVSKQMPNVRFRLVGTAGMFPTEAAVRGHFPTRLQPFLEIVPKFPSDDLPGLLAPCSLGIFPSRVEGFPFGVLEMLAASLPVIAYDVPGPRMTLPADYLVPAGDAVSMSRKIVTLLRETEKLAAARLWAKQRSQQYHWKEIAEATHEIYSHYLVTHAQGRVFKLMQ